MGLNWPNDAYLGGLKFQAQEVGVTCFRGFLLSLQGQDNTLI
jgi:hypothetical protein